MLAIIVTIGLIAAGLIVLAWFWYFAPQAGKTGTLQILGQPVIICLQGSPRAVLSVKNLGTLDLTITGIYAGQMNNTNLNVIVPAGQSKDLTIQLNGSCPSEEKIIIDGVIVTTAGTYPTSFTIIRT